MKTRQDLTSRIENILEALTSWAKPPLLEDPILQRKAEIIHAMSVLILLAGFSTLVITPFVFQNTLRGVSITSGLMLFVFIILVLNRRGHTRIAAQIFIGALWIFDTLIILFSGGFYSQFLPTFISISIMGGLILGEMYAFHLAGLSTAAYLLLFYFNSQGITPEALFVFRPIALILINIITLFQTATVLIMIIPRYERIFKELKEKDADLETTNLNLQQEIIAREEAESQLKLSENQLKSALMESPYPTMLHSQTGEILLVNTAWINSTGYSQKNLPDFGHWLDHMFRENSSVVTEIIDSLSTGSGIDREEFFDIYKENGETLNWYLRWTRLPALADDSTIYLTMAMDMTKLMSIESTLRESEETLSKFALVSNDGLWDWDLQTDKVLYDPLYYTMAGYGVDEFPHDLEEFRKRVHPDDVSLVFTQADEYLNGVVDKFNVEFRFLKKDGSWMWIMGRGKITQQDQNGNPLRFMGTHTDISAQKLVEEKLSDYQLQLEDIVEYRTQELSNRITEVERLNIALTNILDDYQAANERLSVLGNNLSTANQELESLTYSLSTDLREPITAIRKTADKLAKNKSKKLAEKELDGIFQIHENAIRVNRQINDLLLISQLSQQELHLEEINPAKLLKKVFKSYAEEIKENGIKTVIKDLPLCLADRDLLEKVFDSLISNAIKFSAGEENPEIQIGYQPDLNPDRGIYYVKDNGIGLNPEIKDTIQQLGDPEKHQGTGIGLTLAKLIVNKHNGRIWAESEEGTGSSFYFDLAISEREQG